MSRARRASLGSAALGALLTAGLGIGLGTVSGCAQLGPEDPAQRAVGVPMGRSERPISGQLTYRLDEVERQGPDVVVRFTLFNGRHRQFEDVMVRIVLRGEGAAEATSRYPLGPLHAGQSKTLTGTIPNVTFPVRGATIEQVWAVP